MHDAAPIQRSRFRNAAAAAISALAASCSPGDSGPGDSGRDESAETPVSRFEVEASSYAYTPAQFESPAGTVRFVVRNVSDEQHGFEVEGLGVEEEIESIPAGGVDSLSVTLSSAGEYEVYCPVDDHEGRGMVGALRVAGGS